jgi:tRNA A37 threonylcarbamoyltransferase TsaD
MCVDKIHDKIMLEIVYCMSERDKFSFCGLKSSCCRLKTAEQEKRKIDMELCEARRQMERMQVINEEHTSVLRCLQKRLLLVSCVSLSLYTV